MTYHCLPILLEAMTGRRMRGLRRYPIHANMLSRTISGGGFVQKTPPRVQTFTFIFLANRRYLRRSCISALHIPCQARLAILVQALLRTRSLATSCPASVFLECKYEAKIVRICISCTTCSEFQQIWRMNLRRHAVAGISLMVC